MNSSVYFRFDIDSSSVASNFTFKSVYQTGGSPKKKGDKLAIEIKFPTNGQYPEQMFSFVKDIKFLEQLKDKGFKNNLFIAFANDHNFWNDGRNEGTIYKLFRKEKRLYGRIRKPTGEKDEVIALKDNYKISWRDVDKETRYFIIKV